MLIKAGVDISRLERNTRRGLQKVSDVFKGHKLEVMVTSTYEGNHSEGSLHYANQAFNVRTPAKDPVTICYEVMDAIGTDFDVAIEGNHIHVEYDPKP